MTNTVKANNVREAFIEQGLPIPEDLQAPEMPDVFDDLASYVWDTFWILSNKRVYTEGYPRPISINDIYCYFSLVPPLYDDDLDLVVEHLNELDTIYLNIVVPRLTKEREATRGK